MLIEEFKETVVHELERAVDEKEVEQIMNRYIVQFPKEEIYRYLVLVYLHILQNGLGELSVKNVESGKRCNVRHALNYLSQKNGIREKIK